MFISAPLFPAVRCESGWKTSRHSQPSCTESQQTTKAKGKEILSFHIQQDLHCGGLAAFLFVSWFLLSTLISATSSINAAQPRCITWAAFITSLTEIAVHWTPLCCRSVVPVSSAPPFWYAARSWKPVFKRTCLPLICSNTFPDWAWLWTPPPLCSHHSTALSGPAVYIQPTHYDVLLKWSL